MSAVMLVLVSVCLMLCAMGFAGGPAKPVATCTIKKGKHVRIVNVSDLAMWEEEGWKRVADPPSAKSAAANDDDSQDGGDEGGGDLADAVNACKTHADLDAFIAENGLEIEGVEDMTVADKKAAILEIVEG